MATRFIMRIAWYGSGLVLVNRVGPVDVPRTAMALP